MKRLNVLYSVIWVCLLGGLMTGPARAEDNRLTDDEKQAGWRLLFNGRDFTGWKCNNGRPIASKIEDGAIAPYRSGGYLVIHEQQFGDFILKCDVKMSDDCNSGVFIRVGDPLDPVQTGLEVQVLDDREGTGYSDFGAVYDLAGPARNILKGPGEWNSIVITCRGPLVSVAVNGETVTTMNCDDFPEPGQRPDGTPHKFAKAIKDFPRKGFLGFQDHGHHVWFKNVKLLELTESR